MSVGVGSFLLSSIRTNPRWDFRREVDRNISTGSGLFFGYPGMYCGASFVEMSTSCPCLLGFGQVSVALAMWLCCTTETLSSAKYGLFAFTRRVEILPLVSIKADKEPSSVNGDDRTDLSRIAWGKAFVFPCSGLRWCLRELESLLLFFLLGLLWDGAEYHSPCWSGV